MQVRRPALRYHGGKWRIAPWIISQFPPHICYVEPFGGGGSVLLRKKPSCLEVYNDADKDVVNFFQVLREQPDQLLGAIELTPYARSEVELAYQSTSDPLERARRFYVRSWQVRGGPRTQWKSGWRFQRSNARGKRVVDDWNETDHLLQVVERLKQVQIENDDALSVIERFDAPATLFYLDPPYPAQVRSDRWGQKSYQHEMSEDDHRRLAEMLGSIQGMAIISSYPSDLYDRLYAGWTCVSRDTITDAVSRATEALWISPHVTQAKLPLFAWAKENGR